MGPVIISKSIRAYLIGIGDIISFLMVSSVFTAFTSLMMLYFSFIVLGVTPKPILLCAMFLVIYGVYSLNKVTDRKEDAINMPVRSTFVSGNERFLLTLAIASYTAALLLGLFESPFAASILLVPFLSGVIYSTNSLSIIGIPRLKDIFLVKSLIVAFSLAVCAAFLPAIHLHSSAKLYFIFPFFFSKVFINTVLFDVRDVGGDSLNGVKTIPVVIGIKRTRQMLLLIQSLLVVWFVLFSDLFSKYYVILITSMVYGYLYILYFCNTKHHSAMSWDILLDGEWISMSIGVWLYLILFSTVGNT
ncbi:MAG: prenyltransferase [Candidatus Methanogaster sp.]|uniref:Prenyltransferase n=1 Tax=Candidatus Methanogaster sp. TaxID=3386292 RepID=A0AC61KZ36_9EURY|nr:MAG: prenyltransferase [ANME-2 cluster archaeon]